MKYSAQYGAPRFKKDVDKLKEVPRATTKTSRDVGDMMYKARLEEIGFCILEKENGGVII